MMCEQNVSWTVLGLQGGDQTGCLTSPFLQVNRPGPCLRPFRYSPSYLDPSGHSCTPGPCLRSSHIGLVHVVSPGLPWSRASPPQPHWDSIPAGVFGVDRSDQGCSSGRERWLGLKLPTTGFTVMAGCLDNRAFPPRSRSSVPPSMSTVSRSQGNVSYRSSHTLPGQPTTGQPTLPAARTDIILFTFRGFCRRFYPK